MTYQICQAKSALHRLNNDYLPFQYDLNIYRGCEHRCVYCYALYSHQYLNEDNFFDNIYVKANIAELLDRELSTKRRKDYIINLGGVTDSYQPAEAQFKLMRDVLSVCIKHSQPIVISTKSKLILRDLDLFANLAQKTFVGIGVTLITTEETLQSQLEPKAAIPKGKLEIISAFKETRVRVGCHCMPIIPYLTDDRSQLKQLFEQVAAAKADYILTGLLHLRGQTRQYFLRFLQDHQPEIFAKFQHLYGQKNSSIYKEYKANLYQYLAELRNQYRLYLPPDDISDYLYGGKQLTLF